MHGSHFPSTSDALTQAGQADLNIFEIINIDDGLSRLISQAADLLEDSAEAITNAWGIPLETILLAITETALQRQE